MEKRLRERLALARNSRWYSRIAIRSLTMGALLGTRVVAVATTRLRGPLQRSIMAAIVGVLVAWIAVMIVRVTGLDTGLADWIKKGLTTYVAFAAIAAAVWWVYRARRRVVVEVFTEYGVFPTDETTAPSTDTQGGARKDSTGAATLLAVELADLRRLYADADDERSTRGATAFSETAATLQASDTNNLLTAASAGESTLTIGPLKIPLGILLGLTSRVVRGPRIIGSLHREGTSLVITAQMIGAGEPYSWRVARPRCDDLRSLDALVRELACQIFTDAFSPQPCNHAAAVEFTAGLRVYRECLRTPTMRTGGLIEAERRFREAIARDAGFARAYHNLGIVYAEMNRLESADHALSAAIARDGGAWASYYALAQTRVRQAVREYDRDAYPLAIRYFREAGELAARAAEIAPRPNAAMAHNLAGLAERELADPKLRSSVESGEDHLLAFVSHSQWAARHAAFNLAAVRIRFPGTTHPSEMLAGLCFRNLGIAWDRYASYLEENTKDLGARDLRPARLSPEKMRHKALAYLEIGVRRRPNDPQAHYARGKAASHAGNTVRAVRSLTAAVRIDPTAPSFASRLANTVADMTGTSFDTVAAAAACVLDAPTRARSSDLKRVATAYSKIRDAAAQPPPEAVERQIEVQAIEVARKGLSQLTALSNPELRERLNSDLCVWQRSMLELTLSRALAASGGAADGTESARLCRHAIARLEERHSQEVALLGLHAELGLRLAEIGDLKGALKECETAIELAPLSPIVREMQGDIFERQGDWEHAKVAWEEALLCAAQADGHWRREQFPLDSTSARDLHIDPEPQYAQIHWKLGRCYLELADRKHDSEGRTAAIEQARDSLEQALALLDHGDETEDTTHEQKLSVHYWLGRTYTAMCNYEAAFPHLEISQTLVAAQPVPTLHLAEAHLLGSRHETAERILRRSLTESRSRQGKADDHLSRPAWLRGLDMSVPEAHAKANFLLAVSLLQRDAGSDEARGHLADAQKLFEEKFGTSLTDSARREWSSRLAYGWGLLALKETNFPEAEKRLFESLTHEASAEAYLALARLRERRAPVIASPGETRRAVEDGRSHLAHARLLDRTGRHSTMVKSLDESFGTLLAATARRRRTDTDSSG